MVARLWAFLFLEFSWGVVIAFNAALILFPLGLVVGAVLSWREKKARQK